MVLTLAITEIYFLVVTFFEIDNDLSVTMSFNEKTRRFHEQPLAASNTEDSVGTGWRPD